MQVSPYLGFNGTCEEAFEFYAQCFGGRITAKMTYGETPMADQVPAEWRARIIHATLQVGEIVLMGGDSTPGDYVEPKGISLALMVDSAGEAERIFSALAENGTVLMPLEQTFWAERFGMVKDRFGISWMVNYTGKVSA